MTPEQAAALRRPFAKSAIGQLPKGNVMLDYCGHAAVTDRLLVVDPEWSWEPFATDEHGLPAYQNGCLWIRLTVCGVTRIGVGDGPDPKQRIGDAIRNAAMRFGVALDLWSKQELEQDPNGGDATARQPERKAERQSKSGPPVEDPWKASDPVAVQEWQAVVAAAADKDALASAWADLNALCSTGQINAADRPALIDEWTARKAEVVTEDAA